jgi:anti-anti-sigma factor
MTINKTQENSKISFAIDGRLDTTTAPQLEEALLPVFDEANEIVLDVANLAYVSSAGLRVLLLGQKTAKEKGVSMTICNVSAEVMGIFEMTGFADILTIV